MRTGCADGLNITRMTAGPVGLVFAPSWEILRPEIAARRGRDPNNVERWDRYALAYTREMRENCRSNRAAWAALLEQPRVVLLCYCWGPARCHRTVLGRDILPKLGAVYEGELE